METSREQDLRADFAGRMKRTIPPPAVATMGTTRVVRSRLVRPDIARAPHGGDPDDTYVAVSGDGRTRLVRSTALRDVATQTLARSGDYLLADARDACRREGVAATRRQLLMRVAKRVGLSQAEVARGLSNMTRCDRAAAASAAIGARHLRDRVSQLAATILGAREREVFLARRHARPDDIAAVHELAANLGVSVERVYELDGSARRKLARALG